MIKVKKLKLSINERMKKYEQLSKYKILPYQPYLIIVKGIKFNSFTKYFRKPFDNLFICVMTKTMNDMVNLYSARTGYCHSDEITLILPSICTKEVYEKKIATSSHLYDEIIMKLCNIIANYCSVRFNYHLNNVLNFHKNNTLYGTEIIKKITSFNAHFDTKVIGFPEDNEYELVNMIVWRSIINCRYNAISTYAKMYYSAQELDKKNLIEKIKMLEERGVKWDNVPLFHKHGIYAKYGLYEKTIIINKNSSKEKTISAIRQKILNKSFVIQYSDKMYKLLTAKIWDIAEINIKFYNITITYDGQVHIS